LNEFNESPDARPPPAQTADMRIGVIGAGELGGSLAQWWSEAGHDVLVSTATGPGLVPGDSGVSVPEAAAFGQVVLFAPEWAAAHDVLDAAGGALTGKPVLDATNPVVWTADHGYERALPDGFSGIETLAEWAPDAQWVKAFNTFSASVLRRRRGRDPLLAEFICTDSREARTAATHLVRDVGFAPIFAGGAHHACLTETGGPLQMREVDIVDATATLARAVEYSV
jgi:predicted dinucleotide-binding enzyme